MIPTKIVYVITLGLVGICYTLKKVFIDGKIKSKTLSKFLSFMAFVILWAGSFYTQVYSDTHNISSAIYKNDVKLVEKLLDAGEKIDQRDKDNATLLHMAITTKHETPETIELLLKRGADINATMDLGITPLYLAVALNKIKNTKTLLKYNPQIDLKTEEHSTALHCAIARNNPQMVRLLLSHKANQNITIENGITSLHFAVSPTIFEYEKMFKQKEFENKLRIKESLAIDETTELEKNQNIISLLLTHGTIIDKRMSGGLTPLHLAIISNNIKSINLLLKHNANINLRAESQATPLLLAIIRNNPEMVQLLLSQGANPNIPDLNGITPLRTAVDPQIFSGIQLMMQQYPSHKKVSSNEKEILENNQKIVELLLLNKADTSIKDKKGFTPLHATALTIQAASNAAKQASLRKLQILLQHNADIEAKNKIEATPLAVAVANNNLPAAKMLLAHKACVNTTICRPGDMVPSTKKEAKNFVFKASILYYAISGKNKEMAELLLSHGAHVNTKVFGGITPLMTAIIEHDADITKLLLNHKANHLAVSNNGKTALDLAKEENCPEIIALLSGLS